MAAKDRLVALNMATDEDFDCPDVWLRINMKDAENEHHLGDFFEHVDEVQQLIAKIEVYVGKVKAKHSEILADPNTGNELKNELASLMSIVKRTSNKARSNLQLIRQDLEAMQKTNNKSVVAANYRIRLNQYNSLTKKYLEVMNEYNGSQVTHRQKCKERIQRQLALAGRETTDEELEEMIEAGNPQIFTQGIEMDTRTAKATLADIQARHEDIMKLENNIRELHQIFVDVALLIECQSPLVDRIANNVGEAEDAVKRGREDVTRGTEYKDKWRKKKLCMIGILVTIVLILLVIIIVPATQSTR